MSQSGPANPLRHRGIIESAKKLPNLAQRFASRLPNHPHRHIARAQSALPSLQQTLRVDPIFSSHFVQYLIRFHCPPCFPKRRDFPPLFLQSFYPITYFLHKGLVAEHRLPPHRVKWVVNLPHQALLHKTTITHPLRSPGSAQFAQHHLILHKRECPTQTSVPTIAAPPKPAQPLTSFTWTSPTQAHSAHRI